MTEFWVLNCLPLTVDQSSHCYWSGKRCMCSNSWISFSIDLFPTFQFCADCLSHCTFSTSRWQRPLRRKRFTLSLEWQTDADGRFLWPLGSAAREGGTSYRLKLWRPKQNVTSCWNFFQYFGMCSLSLQPPRTVCRQRSNRYTLMTGSLQTTNCASVSYHICQQTHFHDLAHWYDLGSEIQDYWQ